MKLNKRYVKVVLCAVLITFVAAIGMGIASEASQSITGEIQQTDAGLVIVAEDGQYILSGQDLSAMVGKQVKVTGMIIEAESGKTINVLSFEEIQ